MENYPPNRNKDKIHPPEERDVKRVTSSEPIRRKKPLKKQFKETFLGGDAKTAVQYMFFGVLVPAAKDMIVDAGSAGIEKLIFGDSRRRGGTTPQSGPTGYVNYQRYRMASRQQEPMERVLSQRARTTHDFDEIILTSRSEAENVIDRLYDVISQYGQVSVSDLYVLVGLKPEFTDHKWGWTDLSGAGVARVRSGYLLDLPEPKPIDS